LKTARSCSPPRQAPDRVPRGVGVAEPAVWWPHAADRCD